MFFYVVEHHLQRYSKDNKKKKVSTRCSENYADERFDLKLPRKYIRAGPSGICIKEIHIAQ